MLIHNSPRSGAAPQARAGKTITTALGTAAVAAMAAAIATSGIKLFIRLLTAAQLTAVHEAGHILATPTQHAVSALMQMPIEARGGRHRDAEGSDD